jgi:hypothetical protein
VKTGGTIAALALMTGAALAGRHDGGAASFELPAGWRAENAADVSAEHAWKLTPEDTGKRPPVVSVLVLVGAKKVSEAELDAEAGGWHGAHMKNRAAWGMRGAGGVPRDVFRHGGKKHVRWRDRVESAIGASEQTMICASSHARLVCIIAHATPDTRDDADNLALALLSSVSPKKR